MYLNMVFSSSYLNERKKKSQQSIKEKIIFYYLFKLN